MKKYFWIGVVAIVVLIAFLFYFGVDSDIQSKGLEFSVTKKENTDDWVLLASNDKTTKKYDINTNIDLNDKSWDKEQEVRIENITEKGEMIIVETYQYNGSSGLYNYFVFYKSKLIDQGSVKHYENVETVYFDDVYALEDTDSIPNGNIKVRVYNVNSGEVVYEVIAAPRVKVVGVGDNFICFSDDTFFNINKSTKEIQNAWSYLAKEVNNDNLIEEYKLGDSEPEQYYKYKFMGRDENNFLVYNLFGHKDNTSDGEMTVIEVVKIPLQDSGVLKK